MGAQPIFVVQISIDETVEDEWNEWYARVHVPEVMAASDGITSATRYHLESGTIGHNYLAVYSFIDQASLDTFITSEILADMGRRYDTEWGAVSQRLRGAYLPILHMKRVDDPPAEVQDR
jgi:hypothetical protein